MTSDASVSRWNEGVLCLVHACLGAITENFRMIVLDREGNKWKAVFYLDRSDPSDLEEIDEVREEFLIIDDSGGEDLIVQIVCGDAPLPVPEGLARAIFMRKNR